MSNEHDNTGPKRTEGELIRDLCQSGIDPILLNLNPDHIKTGILQVPDGKGGYQFHSIQPFLDEIREKPERKSGTAEVETLASVVEHANRFKTENSVVFITTQNNHPVLQVIYDYHHPTGGVADFMRHRCKFAFPLSLEYMRWIRGSENPMSQVDFAYLIEELIADVIDPPSFEGIDDRPDAVAADIRLRNTIKLLGVKLASPLDLMRLKNGIQIHEASRVKNIENLNTGEKAITFETEHSTSDSQGDRIAVPTAFLIQIPIFTGGSYYQILVLLRYRKRDGKVVWAIELHHIDRIIQHAIDADVAIVAEKTGLPVIYGMPEPAPRYRPAPQVIRVSS